MRKRRSPGGGVWLGHTVLAPAPCLKRSSHLSPHFSLPPCAVSRSAHCPPTARVRAETCFFVFVFLFSLEGGGSQRVTFGVQGSGPFRGSSSSPMRACLCPWGHRHARIGLLI